MSKWHPNTRVEAERAAWDADTWEEGVIHHLAMLDTLVNFDKRIVLDFGCGPGRLMRPLAERGNATEIIGYDPNMRMLAWGTDMFRVFTRPCDVPRVDVVYSTLVFQHLTPIERRCAFADISRMLVSAGVLAFQYVDAMRSHDEGPYHHPAPTATVCAELESFGLDVVEQCVDPVYPTWSWIAAVKRV